MEKDIINKYISNFRTFLSPYMKGDVVMKSVIYPYDDGAIMVVELSVGGSSFVKFESNSVTLIGAMSKSNLFEEPDRPVSIIGTKIVVSNSKIVIIKSSNDKMWSAKAAFDDVNNIMNFISEKKYGRR